VLRQGFICYYYSGNKKVAGILPVLAAISAIIAFVTRKKATDNKKQFAKKAWGTSPKAYFQGKRTIVYFPLSSRHSLRKISRVDDMIN
jgi:hypothetical protein